MFMDNGPMNLANTVRKAAKWVTSRRGGDAAVREVCDVILSARQ